MPRPCYACCQEGASTAGDPSRVLLPVHTNTFFVELHRVARLLQRSGRYEPVFLFAWPYPTLSRDRTRCLEEGFRCVDAEAGEAPPSWGAAVAQRLSRPVIGDALHFLRFHRERRRLASRVLRQERCALLVMAGDMVGYDTADFVAAARGEGIPVVLVPSTMSNGLEQAEVYYHDPAYQVRGFSNRLAGAMYPRWVRRHRGRALLRRPAGDVFAMERLGIAPPLPWIFNSGHASAVAAESHAMVRYYLDCGLPAARLLPVGSPANDLLAERLAHAAELRERLYAELGLPAGRPMVLSALPPDFLYVAGGRPECDFTRYDDLVAFWMEALRSVEGHNVVLALHPSVAPETLEHLATDNVRLGPQDTAALIPLCDLYVASVSSTIRWAIACGKPVINYDVYRYRYSDFNGVGGVVPVEERSEFLALLERITRDRRFYEDIATRQRACAGQWGLLDGGAGGRILELFNRLITTGM